jgi:iron(III) transport system substrate-binding protein
LLAVGAIALGLTACSGSDPDQPTGSLTVACVGSSDLCRELTAAFQTQTAVVTDFIQLDPLDPPPAAGQADLWHGASGPGLAQAQADGRLQAYRSPQAAELPAEVSPPDGWWVGLSADPIGFCSNRTVLDELGLAWPQTWDELLAPGWQGQIALGHPAVAATSYQALWNLEQSRGADAAFDYLRALNPAVLQYTVSDEAALTLLQTGQVALTWASASACASAAADQPTLVWSAVEDGAAFDLAGLALLAEAANPRAAQAYIDWALSAAAQNLALAQGDWRLPTAPAAELVPGLPPLRLIKLIPSDPAAAQSAHDALVGRFNAEIALAP